MGPDDTVRDTATKSQFLPPVVRPVPPAIAKCLDRVRQSLQVTFKEFVADGRQSKNGDSSDSAGDSSGLVQIRCRDAQRDQIVAFCREHATKGRAGSLYVCGCPGTGKTLMLSQVAKEVSTWTNAAGQPLCAPVYVNCMALTDPADLFPQLERAIAAAQAAHPSSPPTHRGRQGGQGRGGKGGARTSGQGEGAREAVQALLQQEEGVDSGAAEGAGGRDGPEGMRSPGSDADVVEVTPADAGNHVAGKGGDQRGRGGGRRGGKGGGEARRVLRLRENEGEQGQGGGRGKGGGDTQCSHGGSCTGDASSGGGKGGRKAMILVVADEVDQLVRGRDCSALTHLFQLPFSHALSRCILVGISNSIHLIDSVLPHLSQLNSRGVSARPTLLPFPAYDRNQIYEILSQRLQAAAGVQAEGAAAPRAAAGEGGGRESASVAFSFEPMALHLCARKVAAASGDMRKALDITRMAVDVLEDELRAEQREVDVREAASGTGPPGALPAGAAAGGRSNKRVAGGEADGQAESKRQRDGVQQPRQDAQERATLISGTQAKGLAGGGGAGGAQATGCTNGGGGSGAACALGAEAACPSWSLPVKLDVHHMAQALSCSFASSTVDSIRSLPLHQQMVLVACVQQHQQQRARHRFISKGKPASTTKDFLLSQLYSTYMALARSLHVPAVTLNEATDMCGILQGQALLQFVGAGKNAARPQAKCKVMLKASASDVIFALQGVRLFKQVLTDIAADVEV
ncbi:hypothetical protein CLOM_g10911 [Closterium sp. NIES-68]|nr:hypothetical protein CLOM_g10911 [Closterium sp. NIES-68]